MNHYATLHFQSSRSRPRPQPRHFRPTTTRIERSCSRFKQAHLIQHYSILHCEQTMRYHLRTLTIVLALGPMVFAASWFGWQAYGEESIRREYRSYIAPDPPLPKPIRDMLSDATKQASTDNRP